MRMTHDIRIPIAGLCRLVLLSVAVAGLTAACGSRSAAPAASANAWAVVNGHEITRDDVEKAYRRNDQAQQVPDDEALAAKLGVLDDLITQDLLLAKARELKVDVPDAELDKAFTEARKDMTEDAFKQELAKRSLTAADMREALRRDLVVQKLLEREVTSKVSVTDQDVSAFFEANKAQFNRAEDSYRVAQLVITPVREEQIANRAGSDATTPQEADAKAKMIMERLKAGAEFSEVAADFSEDPQSAPRGGDLGFLPASAVQKYPPALRDAVLAAKPGAARVIRVNGGYVIVVVLGKDPAGQKDLNTPGVKDAIRQTLKGQREQLLHAAYLNTLHNGVVIDNVMARHVVEAHGKVPAK